MLMGGLYLASGVVGIVSVLQKSASFAKIALVLYVLLQIANCVLNIIYLTQVDALADVAVKNMQPDAYYGTRNDTKTNVKVGLKVTFGCALAFTIIVTLVVVERMVTYSRLC